MPPDIPLVQLQIPRNGVAPTIDTRVPIPGARIVARSAFQGQLVEIPLFASPHKAFGNRF